MNLIFLVCALCVTIVVGSDIEDDKETNTRNGRFFPFWAFVQIPEERCSMDGNDVPKGVCYNTKACQAAGGVSDTSCAQGFGSCCIIKVSAISETEPYVVRHPVVTLNNENNLQTSKFSFPKLYVKNIEFCQIRLDFLSSFEGPATEGDNAGDCRSERIVLPGSSGSLSHDLVICGKIDGQHAYLSFDTDSSSEMTVTVDRHSSYDIRATYVPCSEGIPSDCFQYYKNSSARVTSFNYMSGGSGQHLNTQRYKICVRTQQAGSKILWDSCPEPNSFFVTGDLTTPFETVFDAKDYMVIPPMSMKGEQCVSDYVRINGERYCGSLLYEPIEKTDLLEGSQVTVYFDDSEYGDGALNFSCAAIVSMGFEHKGYQCHYTPATGTPESCYCIPNPRYIPVAADKAFGFTILMTQLCPDILGPYYCRKNGDTMCDCFRRIIPIDLHNNGFCLEYNIS